MPGPIEIDRQLCLNFNYKKISCRCCRDACPKGCLAADLAVDGERCDECGLCLAVCPAEAVGGEGFPPAALENMYNGDQPIILACRRRRENSPWPCLGFLDGRLLLSLALSGREVAVDDSGCAACRPAVAEKLATVMAEVDSLLARCGQGPLLQGAAAAKLAEAARPISRRAFFSALLGASLETVREVVNAGAGGGAPIPRHRWFAARVRAAYFAGSHATSLFPSMAISEACLACGLCIRVCPRDALTAEDHGDALDFYHHPARCTGCGLCAAHCAQAALRIDPAGCPETYLVARRQLPRCEGCGQVFQPVGNNRTCLECLLSKANRTIFNNDAPQEDSK